MVYEVAGIEKIDYPSRSTGRQVTGTRLHLHYSDDRINGTGCKSVYCPDRLTAEVSTLSIGDRVQVFYNEFKSVDCVQLV